MVLFFDFSNNISERRMLYPLNLAIPPLFYGTAWKNERTKDLVYLAVKTGFRAIDTACQPKHYFEKGVGDALSQLYLEGVVRREEIFLQTKYTPLAGQDPNRIPYDSSAPLQNQVLQSFEKSLENLQTSYLDSLILHSPMKTLEDTLRVWQSFEQLHSEGRVRYLGISNIYSLQMLEEVYERVSVKPKFIQNRFYKSSGYDVALRQFCNEKGILYQSFWTLTANPHIVKSELVTSLAKKYGKTKEQIFFSFIKSLDIYFLTGTSSQENMLIDLEASLELPFLTIEEKENIFNLLTA